MLNRWTLGVYCLALFILLTGSYVVKLGPEPTFFVVTGLQLLVLLLGLVLLFMAVSAGAIAGFGRLFRNRLTQSYVLFLGWNMLRSQRMTTPLRYRVGQSLASLSPEREHRGIRSLLLFCSGVGLLFVPTLLPRLGVSIPSLGLHILQLTCYWAAALCILVACVGTLMSLGFPLGHPRNGAAIPIRLRHGVTLPNFISMVGIGIGVWALIVVMAVMSGFEGDLRSKILTTNAHVLISPPTMDSPFSVSNEAISGINALPGVLSTDVFLEEEAMITSPYNSSVQLTIRGVDPDGTTGKRISDTLKEGSLALLKRPHAMGSDMSWEFTRTRKAHPMRPPIAKPQATGSLEIVMPPMPGGKPIREPNKEKTASQIPVLVGEDLARSLDVSVGGILLVPSGKETGELSLEIVGIFRKDEALIFQPDWVISAQDALQFSSTVQEISWPLRRDEKETLGRMLPLTPATPLAAALGKALSVGTLSPLLGPIAAPDESRPVAERVYPGVILGRELASSLRVQIGDEVQLISLDGEMGPMGVRPKARTFSVAGIFETGMYEFDLKLAFALREELAHFMGSPNTRNRLEVQLEDPASPEAITQAVRALLPPDLSVQNWQSLNRNLFSALKLEKIAMFFVLGFIILVASFNIVSSLAMLIQEKSQEIAILKSMGATDSRVMKAFVSVGLFLGLIGSGCGALLGVGCCIIIDRVGVPLPKEYYIPTIPVEIDGLEVLAACFAAMFICVIATLFPSRAASKLNPVEGLRYE